MVKNLIEKYIFWFSCLKDLNDTHTYIFIEAIVIGIAGKQYINVAR